DQADFPGACPDDRSTLESRAEDRLPRCVCLFRALLPAISFLSSANQREYYRLVGAAFAQAVALDRATRVAPRPSHHYFQQWQRRHYLRLRKSTVLSGGLSDRCRSVVGTGP